MLVLTVQLLKRKRVCGMRCREVTVGLRVLVDVRLRATGILLLRLRLMFNRPLLARSRVRMRVRIGVVFLRRGATLYLLMILSLSSWTALPRSACANICLLFLLLLLRLVVPVV